MKETSRISNVELYNSFYHYIDLCLIEFVLKFPSLWRIMVNVILRYRVLTVVDETLDSIQRFCVFKLGNRFSILPRYVSYITDSSFLTTYVDRISKNSFI